MTRLLRLAFAAALGAALAGPAPAWAQTAPASPPAGPAADPPARVGRIARIDGAAEFRAPGADHWDPAVLNYPVTDGDALRTPVAATAAIEIGGSRLTLDADSELGIGKLDGQSLVASLQQGEMALRLRHLLPGETLTIFTRHGAVRFTQPGRYGLFAGDTERPSSVSVLEGQALLLGEQRNVPVPAGQTAWISGDQPLTATLEPVRPDPFLLAMLPPEAPPVPAIPAIAPPPDAMLAAPPPLMAELPGGAELGAYGVWATTPEYGTVWYPAVAPGWVPYRAGHWAFIAPWGWTWIDDEPWGFTPFHYGRWAEFHDRWCWVPYGRPVDHDWRWDRDRPVYAPALVGFVGGGGEHGRPTGWFPLGYGEPYRPWYHASPDYLRDVNRGHVRDLDHVSVVINNDRNFNNYANLHATTAGNANTFVGGWPGSGESWRQPPGATGQLRPLSGTPGQPAVAHGPTAAVQAPMPQVIHPPQPRPNYQQHRDPPPPVQQQPQQQQPQQQRYVPQQTQPQRAPSYNPPPQQQRSAPARSCSNYNRFC
jgi:hypothetical protein